MNEYYNCILRLENAIAHITSELSYSNIDGREVKKHGDSLKSSAIAVIKEISGSEHAQRAISNISFVSKYTSNQAAFFGNYESRVEDIANTYRQGVQVMLNILNQEKARIHKEQQDEEQKTNAEAQAESNRLQRESIKWAKIAAIVGIVSIIVSIILYFC